ncbi:MAG: signal recognition particle-docking protein FtsY [Anaerolineae bacterium]|jgi:fused signal recognition particle receptor|nr:signal recognition particle-docking protein FtsY [Anaerolineae bacterium]MBT7069794.1 signal recognition particle-docking protein FtsY [Anaerolineae bacterium]MBT7326714.1 signal recognition particle-docking protein FtsY [Anaerolineae bacterium]MBT7601355.1 signal recognition particle-docking protein FtsY [Anaerolineae bacterium]
MTDTFSRWRNGLAKTSKSAFGRVASLLGATEISVEIWDDLEALLIQADLGIETTSDVIEALQGHVREMGLLRSDELKSALRTELRSRLGEQQEVSFADSPPSVILLVGVNGSGKTTSAAKLGARFIAEGKKVIFGAADTFRAAAVEQLEVWGERIDVDVIAGPPESDPGAVAYNTVQAGIARGIDIALIDTAGRLHTRFNLMEELKKVERVVGKAHPDAPHAVWLVMDTTTGQNALQQARAFKEAVGVTGVILTKLDSSARGGMVFAIRNELGLPILYAGLGEKVEDLTIFDPDAFIEGILAAF